MSEKQSNVPERKYAWADKWIKMTGERARIDAKVNNTYIVYKKNGVLVKEFPEGNTIPLVNENNRDA